MQYKCLPVRELGGELLDTWDALHQSIPCFDSPFLSPWFAKAVGSVRDDVFVTVIEDDQKAVGFFPYQKTGKRAVPVAGILNDCQAVVVRPEAVWSPVDMLRASGLNLWDFDHLLAEQTEVRPFARNIIDSPEIRLSEGFDAYTNERKMAGSKQIEQLQRKRRKIEKEYGGDQNIRFEAISQDQAALERVIEWKINQCERTGTPNFFRQRWAVELVERLLHQDTPGCTGALSVLWVEDQVAAAHFGIRSKGTWHWWFPTYSEDLSRYSPGKLLLLDLCKHVADPGVAQSVIDLGAGDDAYKASFANGAHRLVEGCVSLGSFYATVRSLKNDIHSWARVSPALAPVRKAKRLLKRG